MPLPPGLILNPATGELEGVPTVAGTFAIQLKVRDALGTTRELTDEVTIHSYTPMQWSGDLGPLMATRPATQIDVAIAGGLAPIQFLVQSGALPDGLSIDQNTGVIAGTPTTPGGYAATVRAIDAIAQTADYLLAGTVAENLTLATTHDGRGTVGVPFNAALDRAGGTAPFTYSLASGTLPAGLSLGDDTITGTPIAPSNASVIVRVTDTFGFTAELPFTFDVRAAPILTAGPPRGMVGKAYSYTLSGSGGFPPYTFAASNLPPGLTLNTSTGLISGTPTTAGTHTPTFTLTDALGNTVSHQRAIEIAAALTLSGSYPANVTRGNPYSFTPSAAGGWAPYTFAISAGALPPGLTLNASTGLISGTPTTQGAYSATLRVTDADGSQATMAVNINVAGDLVMTGSVPNYGTTTVAFTGDNLGTTGGTAPVSWSVAAGSLPPGLSLNTATGDISGTPTTPGSYSFTIRATDANASFAQTAFSMTVAAYPTLSGTLPEGYIGAAYSAKYSAAGGHAPLTYSVFAGSLPAGLSLNTSDGTVSGTPTATGASTFTLRATDARGNTVDRAGTVTIYALPSISGAYASPVDAGVAYNSTAVTATGGKPSLSWSLAGGTLPPGLSLNGTTGALTGTPTTAGTYSFTVRVTDANGRTATSAQSVQVFGPVNITGLPRSTATRTVAYSSGATATGGAAPYTWSVAAGSLPPGLSLNAGTGGISGTPTTTGTYTFTLRVASALGSTHTQQTSITVADPVDISGTAGNGTVSVAYGFTPTRTGGWGPFSFAVVAGALPPGLSLNSSTGALTGTPTSPGTYNATLRVTDTTPQGSTDDLAISIVVAAYPTLTLNYPRGSVGKAYSGTASTSGGHSPFSYSIASGALPGGLSLNASTGALTGTPNASGTANFTIRSRDAAGNNADRAGSITIASQLDISGSYASGQQGAAYSSTVTAVGGWGPYSFSHVAGSLPPGLSLSAGGTLSGTPTAAGTYSFTVRATDADGAIADKGMSVTINPSSPLSASASPNPATDYGSTTLGSPITVAADSTVSASGGVPPYSYSWEFVSSYGGSNAMTISFLSGNRIIRGQYTSTLYNRGEYWRCTVSDSGGNSTQVTVELYLEIDREPTGGQ